ncbi:hypothetical protein OIE66_18405 [Nonomuraea sp. NBC_01738]|uniref:hypothetical protein n=1 Tax=Nonomuraea sp. NBC_01738 TaxID=2976003 RepID=UPI002E0F0A2E|nr:hypothetical protein OIE66_18405 [Nonomuraea sp. NBC_01738]
MKTIRMALVVAAVGFMGGLIPPIAAHADPVAEPTPTASPTPSAAPTDGVDEPGEDAISTQAYSVCRKKAGDIWEDGKVHIYWNTDCNSRPICSATGDDQNYGNSTGCQGSDDNRASSVLNTGYSSADWDIVEFRRHPPGSTFTANFFCLKPRDYIENLKNINWKTPWGMTDDDVNNSISAHLWVGTCEYFPS